MLEAGGRTLQLQTAEYRAVFDPCFAGEQAMSEFIREVDGLMQKGQVLKRDRVSFVSRVPWNGQDVVVKRYNHRGFWYSLRNTIKGSRAKRSWCSAQRLLALRIATPEPLAYVDRYQGFLLGQSYSVTRFIRGRRVSDILRDETVGAAEKQQVNDRILSLLRRMAEHGISHGDMKHTNILYDGTDVMLTDLDAMRIGGTGRLRRRRCEQDVERYLRDLAHLSKAPRRRPTSDA